MLYLNLIPIDGVLAVLYGFWSGEKKMAFLVGFLPSVVGIFVIASRLAKLVRPGDAVIAMLVYLLLGSAMGIIGYIGAWYKSNRRERVWLFIGFIAWFIIVITVLLAGMD